MTAPRAALWDMDGTLVDTAELHFDAWTAFAAENGLPFTRADFAATFGKRNPEILRQLYGDRFTDDDIARHGERKEVLYRTAAERVGVALLPGARGLLAGLRDLGFRQAVASSAPRANLDLILRLTGTADFFAALVAAEDTARGKPDPQVFLVAAGKLGVPPERCVVFEDAVAGVEAAKAAGAACVAVTFVGHHPADRLRAAGADRVVGSLAEVRPTDAAGLTG